MLSNCKLHTQHKTKDVISIRHTQNIILRFHTKKIEVWLAVDIIIDNPLYREKISFGVNKSTTHIITRIILPTFNSNKELHLTIQYIIKQHI